MIDTVSIEYQKQIIETQIKYYINDDFIFLDLPYHSNIGDSLIWYGEQNILTKLKFKCLYYASLKTFHYKVLHTNIIIILHGGGNFGDLYPAHNEFRLHILQLYPNNKIIILPQTVYFENVKTARYYAAMFRRHKHLTIFARDNYSYRFLKTFRFSDDIKLLPDMAFCINTEWLKSMSKPNSGKNLYFKRIDKEASETDYGAQLVQKKEYDYGDWPDYGQPEPMLQHLNALIEAQKYAEADEYATKKYLPERIRIGVEFISQYNKIVSNRLHGAILSILLNKTTRIIDNSYGKNSGYYNTWLKDIDSVKLENTNRTINLKRKLSFVWHYIINIGKIIIGR